MVRVPASILLDQELSPAAKLVWICLLDSKSAPKPLPTRLRAKSGLAAATVQRALQELTAAGLLDATAGLIDATAGLSCSTVSLPSALLRDRRLRAPAKLLYGMLQLIQGFRKDSVHVTFAGLSALASITAKPLRHAARRLEATGWLKVSRGKKLDPIHFTLQNAAADQHEHLIAAINRRLKSQHYGENLMRECLTVLINSDEYDDNARPGFLVNPFTSEKLEFDRYYPPKVAFEYNGPQHDGPTKLFPSETEAIKQQARDAIKAYIAKRRGITLIVLRREDLSLSTIREKVQGLLPLNDVDPKDPVVAHLEQLTRAHREPPQKG